METADTEGCCSYPKANLLSLSSCTPLENIISSVVVKSSVPLMPFLNQDTPGAPKYDSCINFKKVSYRGGKRAIKTMMGTILTLYRKELFTSVSFKLPVSLHVESKVLLIKKKKKRQHSNKKGKRRGLVMNLEDLGHH